MRNNHSDGKPPAGQRVPLLSLVPLGGRRQKQQPFLANQCEIACYVVSSRTTEFAKYAPELAKIAPSVTNYAPISAFSSISRSISACNREIYPRFCGFFDPIFAFLSAYPAATYAR